MTDKSLKQGEVIADEPADGVYRLRISNPDHRGALSQSVLDGLRRQLEIVPSCARCLILGSTGTVFSAGYDLHAAGNPPDPARADEVVAPEQLRVFDDFERQPLPVVAAVNGAALGGGLELLLATDVRLAVPCARFGAPAGKLGLVYSPGGLERLLRELPYGVAAELFLAGSSITAERAQALGLIAGIVNQGDLESEAVSMASRIAALSPQSVCANREALRTLRGNSPQFSAVARKRLQYKRATAMQSEEFAEGVRAFHEHRVPSFHFAKTTHPSTRAG